MHPRSSNPSGAFRHKAGQWAGLILVALSTVSTSPAFANSGDDRSGACDPDCSAYVLEGRSVLDPSLYVRLSLDGKSVFDPGWCSGTCPDAPPVDPQSRYWVLPANGMLTIDFDRNAMRCLWDHTTSAELTVLAGVTDGDGKSRKVEVDGYSTIGDDLNVVGLDLTAARRILDQLYQASRFAHRLKLFDREAELAGKLARAAAIRTELAAYVEFVGDLERQLRDVYTSAHHFMFDAEELQGVTAAVVAAQEKLKRAQRRDEAQKEAELAIFHTALAVERAGLTAWLDDLRGDDTAEYLDVLAGLAGRDPKIVRAVAQDIAGVLEALETSGEVTPAQREVARRKLVAQADKVLDIEADLYHRFESHPNPDDVQCREQFGRHAPKKGDQTFDLSELTPPRVFLREKEKWARNSEALNSEFGTLVSDLALQAKKAKPKLEDVNELLRQFSPETCPNITPREDLGDTAAMEERLFERRVQSIESILKVRSDLSDSVRRTMKERFASQIHASLAAYRGLQRELIVLESAIASEQLGLCALAHVHRNDDLMSDLDRLSDGLRAALLVEVIDALIDRVPSTQLDLGSLGLDRGDRLDLHVSLLPVPAGQKSVRQNTYSFEVQPSGWRAPAPVRFTDTLSFAKGKGGEFEPRPGASAIWNFYGDGRRAGSFWRTVAPGLGITATFLDFSEADRSEEDSGDDDESIEVGLGLSLTLFDNLLAFTWGRNLMAEQEGSREYFAIGFSVLETVDKFKKSTE